MPRKPGKGFALTQVRRGGGGGGKAKRRKREARQAKGTRAAPFPGYSLRTDR